MSNWASIIVCEKQVTHLTLVSSVVVQLAKSPLTEKYNLSSLQHVYCGGAKISSEVKRAFCTKVGLDNITEGMSDTLSDQPNP